MGDNPHAHANSVELSDEEIQCLELRRDGLPLREIAKRTGLSHGTVDNRIKAAIVKLQKPLAEEVRTLELERMDKYIEKLMEQIKKGIAVARNVEVAIKVGERRSKLLGLDATESLNVNVTEVTQADIEFQELLAEARAKQATKEASLNGHEQSNISSIIGSGNES